MLGPLPLTAGPLRADRGERLFDQAAELRVIEIAGGRDDHVRRDVGVVEILPQRLLIERLDGLRDAENRPAERMALPVGLGEDFVDQIVGRVLDHLDLFENHLLLAFDVVFLERGVKDDVGEDVERERQVLVEHLDVIAGVLFGGEGVELPADRIDFLSDVFGRAAGRALEEHVLDEVGDAAALVGLVARAARQPHPDADGTDVRHGLGDESKAVVENIADNHCEITEGARMAGGRTACRKKDHITSPGPSVV